MTDKATRPGAWRWSQHAHSAVTGEPITEEEARVLTQTLTSLGLTARWYRAGPEETHYCVVVEDYTKRPGLFIFNMSFDDSEPLEAWPKWAMDEGDGVYRGPVEPFKLGRPDHIEARPEWRRSTLPTPKLILVSEEDYYRLLDDGDIRNGIFVSRRYWPLQGYDVNLLLGQTPGTCRVTYWDGSEKVESLESYLYRPPSFSPRL